MNDHPTASYSVTLRLKIYNLQSSRDAGPDHIGDRHGRGDIGAVDIVEVTRYHTWCAT